jgi:hypothetical protein
MPSVIQLHPSWAEARSLTDEQVVKERSNGGMPSPKADIRDHEEFVRAYGECVIPKLHWPEMG